MTEIWTKAQTRRLIRIYRKYPDLYDLRHPNYLQKHKRNEILVKIQQHLVGIKPGVSLQDIKAKIKTLQNQLTKERNRMHQLISREGSCQEGYKAKLWCYEDLQFLIPTWQETNESSEVRRAVSGTEALGDGYGNQKDLQYEEEDESSERIFELVQIAEKCLEASEALMKFRGARRKSKVALFCEYLCSELDEIQFNETFDEVTLQILKSVYAAKKAVRVV